MEDRKLGPAPAEQRAPAWRIGRRDYLLRSGTQTTAQLLHVSHCLPLTLRRQNSRKTATRPYRTRVPTHMHTTHGRGTLSAAFESPVTAMLIVRYHMRELLQRVFSSGRVRGRTLAGYFLACSTIQRSGTNPPELPCAEKTVAAGIATVGGKSQPALHRDHGSSFHALAGNVFEIEVSAARTVRVALEYRRHAPSVKAPVAGVASPGPQPDRAPCEIANAAAVRSEAVRTAALRTNHCHPRSQCRRIPKSLHPGNIDKRSPRVHRSRSV